MRCILCKRVLDDPNDRSTRAVDGQYCLRCLAECGDEPCQRDMDELLSSPAPLDEAN